MGAMNLGTDVRLFSCVLLRARLIVLLSRTLSVAVLTEICTA